MALKESIRKSDVIINIRGDILKNITYVIPEFPVVSETFITTEIKALMECGHDIQPVCFYRNDDLCQVGDERVSDVIVDIREVPFSGLISLISIIFSNFISSGWKAVKFTFEQQGIRPRSLFLQGLKLAYLARKHSSDHIHAHFAQCSTATAIVAARLLGVSVSFTSHGSDVYESPSDLLLKLQNANFSIAVCKRMQIDFNNLTPGTQVYLIPFGVDIRFFQVKGKPFCVEAGTTGKLIFLGRLAETKGLLHLIHAVAKLPVNLRPCIDIAGDGYLREEAEKMIADFSVTDSFNFLGPVDRNWVQKKCSNYAAMVSPFSKADNGIMDAAPLVIKEALALKLPLLTTDIMVTGEFVDAESAFICNSSDPDDLARTLLKLLMCLNHITLNHEMLSNLEKVLGPKVKELEVLINHPNLSKIVESKVDQGHKNIVDSLSARKQGLALSKIFQECHMQ